MATTARRIGLSQRTHARKISREEEARTRKISSTSIPDEESRRRAPRPEDSPDIYCSLSFFETSQNNALVRKISRSEDAGAGGANGSGSRTRRRKISVYARPEELERQVNPRKSLRSKSEGTRSWMKDFLMAYEPWIMAFLFLLIISVSIYIVFVEGQSLFASTK